MSITSESSKFELWDVMGEISCAEGRLARSSVSVEKEDPVRKNSELNRMHFLTLRRRHWLRSRGKSTFTVRFLVLVEITWTPSVAIGTCLVNRRGRRAPGPVTFGHLSNRPSIERLLPYFREFPPGILRRVVPIYVRVGFAIGS